LQWLRRVGCLGLFPLRRLVFGPKRLLKRFKCVLHGGEHIIWIEGWIRRYGLKLSHRREQYNKALEKYKLNVSAIRSGEITHYPPARR
jgi:hypothetical protein